MRRTAGALRCSQCRSGKKAFLESSLGDFSEEKEMKATRFFEESGEQSLIKATIVAKYFWAWAKVIIATQKKYGRDRIGYVDLFCGPGRYKDGSFSTPILV